MLSKNPWEEVGGEKYIETLCQVCFDSYPLLVIGVSHLVVPKPNKAACPRHFLCFPDFMEFSLTMLSLLLCITDS